MGRLAKVFVAMALRYTTGGGYTTDKRAYPHQPVQVVTVRDQPYTPNEVVSRTDCSAASPAVLERVEDPDGRGKDAHQWQGLAEARGCISFADGVDEDRHI